MRDLSKAHIRLCGWCGGQIPPRKRETASYCSRDCQTAAYWAFIRFDTLKRKAGRSCQHCGGPIPDTARAGAIYCNQRCNNAVNNARAYQRRKG